MLVRDVMVAPVITVGSSATVQEVAKLFLEKQISAVPVVDNNGKLVGIVSEGDLLHRVEAGTERHRSWWLRALTDSDTLAFDYVKSHSRKVSDVMTREVITTSPEAPLHEVAAVMERNAVKRLPVLENGQLVGVVSRANLLQAVASARQLLDVAPTDKAIRDRILASLNEEDWSHGGLLNITVANGIVDIWGIAQSDAERKAIRVVAESTAGVGAVHDHLIMNRGGGWA